MCRRCLKLFYKRADSDWVPGGTSSPRVWQNCRVRYSETWTLELLGTTKQSLRYERFELWVILPLCFSHVATVASPFRSSIFHFLAKRSKTCQIFSCEKKKTMKLSLSHKNVNTSSHRKGNLMALTAVNQFELWLKVRDMPSKLSLPRQGPLSLVWVKHVFELSRVELTEFCCICFSQVMD